MAIKEQVFKGSIILVLYLILLAVFDGNHTIALPIMLVLTFIISYFVFKKEKANQYLKIGLMLSLPTTIIFTITCILVNDFSRALPYILFIPLSTYLAFLYFKFRKIYILILSVLIFAFISLVIFPNWFIYCNNYDAVKNIPFKEIGLIDHNKNKVVIDKDKVVVLDFWSTSCNICFKQFPDLESVYNKYKNNKNIEFYAVNVPLKRDKFDNTIKILDSIGYKFPKYYAKSFEEVEGKLKFNTFPHLMIIKNGKIRYEGFLETRETSRLFNIEDQIDKLLKED